MNRPFEVSNCKSIDMMEFEEIFDYFEVYWMGFGCMFEAFAFVW